MAAPQLTVPSGGTKITNLNGNLQVPDNPILPFIEGDGTGPDIWRASVRVFDAAVAKAYGGKRKVSWFEVLAGEKSKNAVPRSRLTRRMNPASERGMPPKASGRDTRGKTPSLRPTSATTMRVEASFIRALSYSSGRASAKRNRSQ